MTKARNEQVSLEATSFYHCYVRCVRRAFLCGEDHLTEKNFDHRKQWIVSRLRFLSCVYAIDLCAYAVMSNHYHVVLHVDSARARAWTKEEVAERWLQLFNGNQLINRWLKSPDSIDNVTMEKVDEIIELWRERLCSISWFMRNVNETIARMANEEENCKGRFWEGRFKSQALLDEAAILSCMAYVDLNPVRASISENLEESDFTSIQQRLYDYAKDSCVSQENEGLVDRVQQQHKIKQHLKLDQLPQAPLMPFNGGSHVDVHHALPFTREDYFELVDKTGRMIREGKRGFIAESTPTIISRFGIDPDKWINHVKHFSRSYGEGIGSPEKLTAYALNFGRRWGKGVGCSRDVYLWC